MSRFRYMLVIALVSGTAATAQDIAGIEDCTKTSGLDKRTGCLQANVNYLQRTLTKVQLDAHRRLQAAEGEIAAMRAVVAELRGQIAALEAVRKDEQKKNAEKVEGKKK